MKKGASFGTAALKLLSTVGGRLGPRSMGALATGVAGAGGVAAGHGLGSTKGYGAAKEKYSPEIGMLADHSSGVQMPVFGPRYALKDLERGLSRAESYNDIESALREAQEAGMVLLAEEQGRLTARAFSEELAKIGAQCAAFLRESEVVSPEASANFERGEFSHHKVAQVLRAMGVATAVADYGAEGQ